MLKVIITLGKYIWYNWISLTHTEVTKLKIKYWDSKLPEQKCTVYYNSCHKTGKLVYY